MVATGPLCSRLRRRDRVRRLACQIRAGQPVQGKEIRAALEAFLARENVKPCTHDLNRRHLEALIGHFRLRAVDQLTEDRVDDWLGHLKAVGCNPGGQSLSLRILRTFCRFCVKKKWLGRYPFEDFKIPRSEFVGRYLSDEVGLASPWEVSTRCCQAARVSKRLQAGTSLLLPSVQCRPNGSSGPPSGGWAPAISTSRL